MVTQKLYMSKDIWETCGGTNWFKPSVFFGFVFIYNVSLFHHRPQILMSVSPVFTERPSTEARNSDMNKTRTLPPRLQPDPCAFFSGSWDFSLLCHCFLKRGLRSSGFCLWEMGHLHHSEYSFAQQIFSASGYYMPDILLNSGDASVSAALVGMGNTDQEPTVTIRWGKPAETETGCSVGQGSPGGRAGGFTLAGRRGSVG